MHGGSVDTIATGPIQNESRVHESKRNHRKTLNEAQEK